MCTILFDSIHYYDEEEYEYSSSKNTRVAIERELEEEQHMIDQMHEEHLAKISQEISEEEQRYIDYMYEEHLANLKEGNQNDK